MNRYRAVMLQGRGGLEKLETVELPVTPPDAGQVRVKVLAAGAGSTDIMMRTGKYIYAPPWPFVPGYESIGIVDAVGDGVTAFKLDDRVAALTVYGSFAEYLIRHADDFVAVPAGVTDAEAVALILNYVTAYQMVHRYAKLQPGQTALVTGANGGVGTALLELLRLHGVHAFGACSEKHFDFIRALGGESIPFRGTSLAETVRRVCPAGVDAAFDIMGGTGARECVRATRRGGAVVGYGFMGTIVNGKPSQWLTLRGFATLLLGARLAGRRGSFYGITALYRKNKQPLKEDLPKLFTLLQEKKLAPVIAHRLPLLAVRRSQELLVAGGVTGKIVLLRELGLS